MQLSYRPLAIGGNADLAINDGDHGDLHLREGDGAGPKLGGDGPKFVNLSLVAVFQADRDARMAMTKRIYYCLLSSFYRIILKYI